VNIILGITGGIAAYKTPSIIAALVSLKHNVRCVVTPSALNFVTEMSLSVMSRNKVISTLDNEVNGSITHITITDWADTFVVVPATANTIAKLAHGIADNALTTIALALEPDTRRIVCPAMNTRMWEATSQRVYDLRMQQGYEVLYPVEGVLACGEIGKGKLPSTTKVVEFITGEHNVDVSA
jgi:phosphopantothenoylcysteine synthetase/decarboxylase